MFWHRSLDDRRSAALRKAPQGPLRDYLTQPIEDGRIDAGEAHYLAIDLELTGLNPRRDQILSIGLAPIDGHDIVHAGAQQLLVVPEVEVGQSASVHGLTDDRVAAGVRLGDAMPLVLQALAGRTLVAHLATVEVGFLSTACERLYGRPLLVRAVDTMALQRRVLRIGFDDEARSGALRLQAARDRYGLPRYRAHEALTDAIAAGELFLGQVAELGGSAGVSLRSLSS